MIGSIAKSAFSKISRPSHDLSRRCLSSGGKVWNVYLSGVWCGVLCASTLVREAQIYRFCCEISIIVLKAILFLVFSPISVSKLQIPRIDKLRLTAPL
jgi:hypothetical protein